MKYAKWMSALMLLFVPIMAAAQLQPSERIVTNVPFSFVVANQVIPAGECTIQSAGTQGSVLTLSNRDAKLNIFVRASAGLQKNAPAVSSMQLKTPSRRTPLEFTSSYRNLCVHTLRYTRIHRPGTQR